MGVGIDRNLEINFNFGRLNMDRTPLDMDLDQERRDLEIDKTDLEFSFSTEYPQVQVDSTEAWADLNRKNIEAVRRESAAEGMQTAREAIGRISAWGDELQRIEQEGGNPLVEQPVRQVWEEEEFNVALVPENPPRIDVEEGEINVQYSPGEIRVHLADLARRVYIEASELNIEVDPEPHIDIRVR